MFKYFLLLKPKGIKAFWFLVHVKTFTINQCNMMFPLGVIEHHTHEYCVTYTYIWPFFCDAIWHFPHSHKRLRKEVLWSYFSFDVFADLLVHEKIYRLNQYHPCTRTHNIWPKRFFNSTLFPAPVAAAYCLLFNQFYASHIPQSACVQAIHFLHPAERNLYVI